MKTLKKTLCLVLAMVMVLGLCAVSASAKLEFTDNDEITYAEAVDVLSGIGILKGDERGFRPTATITRAEAAKIIAYLKIGNATQADALKAYADPFTDVPASHWASGYIAYCVNENIVGGMGDGTYHPNDPVSGLAFAKMLLCALGYGAKDEYTGTNWSISVSKDAIRLGIFEGNIAGASEDPAKREECALYAFNVVCGGDDHTGLKKVTFSTIINDYTTSSSFGVTDANKGESFANDFKLSRVPADDDDAFGRPTGYKWTQKVNGVTKDITANYPDDETQMKLFTAKVKGGDIYDLIGSKTKAEALVATATDPAANDTLKLYIDGVPTVADTLKGYLTKGNDDAIDAAVGNGVETYVYLYNKDFSATDTPDVKFCVDVCIVNTYLAKVTEVNDATSKKEASVVVDVLSNAAISGLSKAERTYETDEFEKGDYVLITVDKQSATKAIKSMELAEVVEAEVTRFNDDKGTKSIVADGTTYKYAKTQSAPTDGGKADDINKGIVDGKDHKLYLDKYGYLIGTGTVTEETNYVYVAKFAPKDNSSYDDKLSTGNVLVADVYYTDGTNKIVTVKTNNKQDDSAGSFSNVSTINDSTGTPGLYKIKTDGSKVILTAAEGAGMSDANVTKGISTAYTDSGLSDDVKYDNKTVFFYVKGVYNDDDDPLSVTVYTGINNVPKSKTEGKDNLTAEAKLKGAILDGKTVKAAWVDCGNFKTDDGDTVYFYNGVYSKGTNNTLYYDVYETGKTEASELKLEYESSDKMGDPVSAAGFYYVKGSDNKLTAVTTSAATEKGDYKYVSGNTPDAKTDSITLVLADTTTKLSLADANIVDLRSSGSIDSADGLADLISGYSDVSIAVSYHKDDNTVRDLYILAGGAEESARVSE